MTTLTLKEALKRIFSVQSNINLFEKQIVSMCPSVSQQMDILYEIGFLINIENMTVKDALAVLKNDTIGKKHQNFNKVKKEIEEMDHFMDNDLEVVEGAEKCRYCGDNRTISYSRQTRSADEGASVFVYCISCKKRYIMNS
jgi:DNA-directed RNA polymerase subunit M/transcription elongation factor TFIIS